MMTLLGAVFTVVFSVILGYAGIFVGVVAYAAVAVLCTPVFYVTAIVGKMRGGLGHPWSVVAMVIGTLVIGGLGFLTVQALWPLTDQACLHLHLPYGLAIKIGETFGVIGMTMYAWIIVGTNIASAFERKPLKGLGE